MIKNLGSKNFGQKGFTLLEVLVMSALLSAFLVGFYEGSQRLALSMRVNQNRTEALMQLRRYGNQWRAGQAVSSFNSGAPAYFLNGTAYTLDATTSSYSATSSTLTKISLTLGWGEPDPKSTGERKQRMNDVYLKY